MKATIDIDDALYRQLKVKAAASGRTIRDLVAEGVRHVLGLPDPGAPAASGEWFGRLSRYAGNAAGEHDLAAIRRSIGRGRAEGGSE